MPVIPCPLPRSLQRIYSNFHMLQALSEDKTCSGCSLDTNLCPVALPISDLEQPEAI